MVMRTTLSKKEFAAALGMKENDLFVQKMFNIVDKDGDNRISFQVRLMQWSKGKLHERLREFPYLLYRNTLFVGIYLRDLVK